MVAFKSSLHNIMHVFRISIESINKLCAYLVLNKARQEIVKTRPPTSWPRPTPCEPSAPSEGNSQVTPSSLVCYDWLSVTYFSKFSHCLGNFVRTGSHPLLNTY
ncbi:hypothetical protein EVAR_24362_1 [Eumeta japonica]|uniref:Uncharacterized protein n=1 Tax=Eumeta variegata TaxID=151549 RepID=A0A4C1Y874_EUMVA|nr:hypothetical protein EVAR_24362_1 [Eumeta japonica]